MVNFFPQSFNTGFTNTGIAGGNSAVAGGANTSVAGGLGTTSVAGGAATQQQNAFQSVPQSSDMYGGFAQQMMGFMMQMMQMLFTMMASMFGQQPQDNSANAGGAGGAGAADNGGTAANGGNSANAGGAGGAYNYANAGGAGGAAAADNGGTATNGGNSANAGGAGGAYNYANAGGAGGAVAADNGGNAANGGNSANAGGAGGAAYDTMTETYINQNDDVPQADEDTQTDTTTYTETPQADQTEEYCADHQADVNGNYGDQPVENDVQDPYAEEPQPDINDYDTQYDGGGNGYGEGDPHFRDFDAKEGDPKWSYDVMGESGKHYSILEDKGIAVNAKFEDWGDKGATIMGEVGLKLGDDQVKFDARDEGDGRELSSSAPTLNGEAIEADKDITLADGSVVRWDGSNNLSVTSNEYTFDISRKASKGGSHMKIDTNINEGGPWSDGVAAHGILGQTADGDGKVRSGDKGVGAQGGGAIETINADGDVVMSEKGDDQVHTHYEVDDLFDTLDNAFARFDAEIGTGLKLVG